VAGGGRSGGAADGVSGCGLCRRIGELDQLVGTKFSATVRAGGRWWGVETPTEDEVAYIRWRGKNPRGAGA